MSAWTLTLVLYRAPGPLESLDHSLTDDPNRQLCPTPQILLHLIGISLIFCKGFPDLPMSQRVLWVYEQA